MSTCDEPPEGIVQPVQCADDTFRDSREPIGREQESQDEKRHTADRVMLEHEQAHGNHGQHPGGQRQKPPGHIKQEHQHRHQKRQNQQERQRDNLKYQSHINSPFLCFILL